MPPARKVDLLPERFRAWLQGALKARGFSGYEELAIELNDMLAAEGEELRIGKSALHAYGSEFQSYARAQQTAQDEIRAFLTEMSTGEEIDTTSALFQQLTTIAFRTQMAITTASEGVVDARDLKELTLALNNLIRSTELRDRITSDYQAGLDAKLAAAVDAGDFDVEAMRKARTIMGFG
ncbi:MAG: phage protein Gp27 family protein [Shimia sp.]